jgi:hypothetical protein
MRLLILPAVACCLMAIAGCETKTPLAGPGKPDQASNPDTPLRLVDQLVEASCGQCQFEMEGSGCDLAIRVDGQAWYVEGSSIDDHGDAHAADGLCNCVRRARVSGEVRDGRFVVTAFQLLPIVDNR